MTHLLAAAWLIAKDPSFAGPCRRTGGRSDSRRHFVRINALARKAEHGRKSPPESWRRQEARNFGVIVLASGVVLTLASIVFAAYCRPSKSR